MTVNGRYVSPRRQEQARQTRRAILDAAARLRQRSGMPAAGGADLQSILNHQFGLLVTQGGVCLRRPDNAWLVEGWPGTSARTQGQRGAA